MKIILIGFMGAGKTTVGKILAKKLKIDLIEMDELVLKKSKRKTINEIFTFDGERRFRELEIEVARQLRDVDQAIISTGGGVVINKIILDYLREKNGRVIFLKTSFPEIVKRLKNASDRPLFKDEDKAKKLFGFRKRLYEEYADYIIETDNKNPRLIVEEIVKLIFI